MGMTKWLLTLVFLASVLARSEPVTIMQSSATNRAGIAVDFETRIEPNGEQSQALDLSGRTTVGPEAIHRWMLLASRKQYFGYDVQVEPAEGKNEFRLKVLPLTIKRAEMGLQDAAKWTELSLPRYPDPKPLRPGEALGMDLLVNPYTGQKVVDYLSIADPSGKLRRQTATGLAHDFRAEDAELKINKPRVSVNGKLVEATRNPGSSASGQVVMIYLKGHGQLLFSLVPGMRVITPVPPFQRSGEIRGSTMTFQVGGDTYEVNCEGRISPGSGAYNLYVSHDPAYQPSREFDPDDEYDFIVGAYGVR